MRNDNARANHTRSMDDETEISVLHGRIVSAEFAVEQVQWEFTEVTEAMRTEIHQLRAIVLLFGGSALIAILLSIATAITVLFR